MGTLSPRINWPGHVTCRSIWLTLAISSCRRNIAGTRHVHRVLARLAADGASVVLSSHRMDDLTALCTEVSLLAAGRVVFFGPVSKLAAETGEIDYRLRTSDAAAARRLADGTPAVRVLPDDDLLQHQDAQALLVRGSVASRRCVSAGLASAGPCVLRVAASRSKLHRSEAGWAGADSGLSLGSPRPTGRLK